MNNFDIAQQIAEDAEVFSYARRGAPILEIRRIMALKGLKNIDIAERLGVSEANVSRGCVAIKISNLIRFTLLLTRSRKDSTFVLVNLT